MFGRRGRGWKGRGADVEKAPRVVGVSYYRVRCEGGSNKKLVTRLQQGARRGSW